MQKRDWIHILFILVVCWFAFFVNNDAIFVDIMESRNLVTAHEMETYDNWLVPTMNGELRLEKPPLPTWIAAGIDMISPDNIALQRGAAGLMATIMVFFLYFFASALTQNKLFGLLSALVLATSFNVIMQGRVATWDIYCHSFMLGAIFFFYRGMAAMRTRWWDFCVAGILLGLSFLGKGPVSFYALLLPFLMSYFFIYRPKFGHKLWPVLLMVLIFILISFWWPLYLYVFHKDMALFVMAKESTAWIERNVRPWYYYWKFFTESGIWSLFLLTGLCWPWLKHKITLKKEYRLAIVWTLLSLVLLSCFPEKKTRYLLPLLIPSAMVVAHYVLYIFIAVKEKSLTKGDKIVFRINAFLPAIIALGMPVALYVLFFQTRQIGWVYYIVVSFLFWLVSYSIFVGGIRLKPLKVFTGMVILLILVETLLMNSVATMFNNEEIKSIRAVREIESINKLPFYYPQEEELRMELVYEAGRRILPWDTGKDTAILDSLPIVLVSGRPAEDVLPESVRERVKLRLVDVYDNNARKKNTKWHSPKFVRYVTVIEKR
ncbi:MULTISPECIES: ArnT family glycosyltransferase [Porphyromonadaceae]|uniref:Glycosyl transferase n=1 Tax=Sanguibacteroides justesenii TaxID=1547597 RepID=A0A0C3R4R3_9PORP|nr:MULTISPECIES: glycosyltransferase family 39 protein [Porphyromonadaceae]KIO44480.1 glycosyl transferase [Sanguibacteroides justesenii]PXZ44555.1 phospholipid carrier-dependent glycosyltransferase [Sanguibacteroides justesenii]